MAKNKLTNKDIDWIEQTLANDESSTDEELVDYFKDEGNLNSGLAIKIVEQRNRAFVDMSFKLNTKGLI